mmetsp:Transcript_58072/g.180431  ORF Transcript_58072/g.180431 Transcript_58072/m.180431 type:complete len:92 (-) Transcript_58072:959-1234(-)
MGPLLGTQVQVNLNDVVTAFWHKPNWGRRAISGAPRNICTSSPRKFWCRTAEGSFMHKLRLLLLDSEEAFSEQADRDPSLREAHMTESVRA